MGQRTLVHRKIGHGVTTLDAVRQAIRSDADVADLSPDETALLAAHLTTLLARVDRVRALGPAYAGVEASCDVQELLTRLEVGSSMSSGVH